MDDNLKIMKNLYHREELNSELEMYQENLHSVVDHLKSKKISTKCPSFRFSVLENYSSHFTTDNLRLQPNGCARYNTDMNRDLAKYNLDYILDSLQDKPISRLIIFYVETKVNVSANFISHFTDIRRDLWRNRLLAVF